MSKAKDRLRNLLAIGAESRVERPSFDIDRFLWVFGNMIQEYFADRLYESIEGPNLSLRKRSILAKAEKWFGSRNDDNWPFKRKWLLKYIENRFFGYRKGTNPEDRRRGGLKKFKEKNPKSESNCQWYLGCSVSERLQADHKSVASRHARSNEDEFQWLCEKHNNEWKKSLIFWGDNFIPFRDYDENDQPR